MGLTEGRFYSIRRLLRHAGVILPRSRYATAMLYWSYRIGDKEFSLKQRGVGNEPDPMFYVGAAVSGHRTVSEDFTAVRICALFVSAFGWGEELSLVE